LADLRNGASSVRGIIGLPKVPEFLWKMLQIFSILMGKKFGQMAIAVAPPRKNGMETLAPECIMLIAKKV
jgi:hypothetical protein